MGFNEKIDILLISPPFSGEYKGLKKIFQPRAIPFLGIAYIASALIVSGYKVKILDMCYGNITEKEFENIVLSTTPRIVGITVPTQLFPPSVILAQKIKKLNKSIKIILGGPHPTVLDGEALKTGVVDFVVRGEGEITTLELIDALLKKKKDIAAVKGVSYMKSNIIIRNEDRELIKNLDALPFPRRDIIMNAPSYLTEGSMITSRGCPSKCIFCAASVLNKREYRARSSKNVLDEMKVLKEAYGYSTIGIVDDNATFDIRRLEEICQLIINTDLSISWTLLSKADPYLISSQLLDLLHQAGCILINIGIESGDQFVLNSIKKGIKLENVLRITDLAYKKEIGIAGSYMIGHHTDTKETVKKTLKFMELMLNEYNSKVNVSINTPFPGTELFINAKSLGVKFLSSNWSDFTCRQPIIENKSLSKLELQNIFYEAKNIEKESTRQFVRAFSKMSSRF